MKRLGLVCLALFVVAAGVRAVYWWQIRGTPLDRWHQWNETDMATYLEQGRRLALGDWWAVEPYHPYHQWQSMAPPETWLRWYGPHTFHQAPAYSYALALLRGPAAPDSDARLFRVKVLQLLIGGTTPLLLALIAARIAGLAAAIATGLLAALYGPLYYLELQILREAPAFAGIAAILLFAAYHADVGARSPAWSSSVASLGLGTATGAFFTLHEIGNVLFMATAAAAVAAHARLAWSRAARTAICMSLGFLVGFSPLLIRNWVVGAGAFDVSCRTAINFVLANEPDAPQGGSVFQRPGAETARLFDAAADPAGHVRIPGAVREVLRSYHGDLGKMVGNAWRRFVKQWTPREVPDNTSFYFYREQASLLRTSPTFAWILAPGAAALVFTLAGLVRRRRRDDAAPPPGAVLVVALFPLAASAALTFVHAVGRFRLYLAVPLLIHAGVFVALMLGALRDQRWRRVTALASLAVVFGVLQFLARDDSVLAVGRSGDRAAAGMIAATDGDWETALRFFADDPTFRRLRADVHVLQGRELADGGRLREAAHAFRSALAEEPDYPPALAGLERTDGTVPRR